MEFPIPPSRVTAQMRPHVHRNLRIRLGAYLTVSILVGGFVIYNAFMTPISGVFPFVGVLIGLGLGFLASRIHKISWDEVAAKVISRIDTFGGIVLVLYILFEVFRSKIVGRFVDASSVTITSFSILAGIMYGRVLGIRGNIQKILVERDIISEDT